MIDDLQYKGLKIYQGESVFRFGTDAVLLASFAAARPNSRAVELCAGTGVISLLVCARTGAHIKAVEIQQGAYSLLEKNIALNDMNESITPIHGDLRDETILPPASADVVIVNPPYDKLGTGGMSSKEAIRIARHEVMCTLSDVAKCASRLLSTGGNLYMIHRSSRLSEIFSELAANRLMPKYIRFVHPRADKPSGLVLLHCTPDAQPGLRIGAPLILYREDGSYTDELLSIYHRER